MNNVAKQYVSVVRMQLVGVLDTIWCLLHAFACLALPQNIENVSEAEAKDLGRTYAEMVIEQMLQHPQTRKRVLQHIIFTIAMDRFLDGHGSYDTLLTSVRDEVMHDLTWLGRKKLAKHYISECERQLIQPAEELAELALGGHFDDDVEAIKSQLTDNTDNEQVIPAGPANYQEAARISARLVDRVASRFCIID